MKRRYRGENSILDDIASRFDRSLDGNDADIRRATVGVKNETKHKLSKALG